MSLIYVIQNIIFQRVERLASINSQLLLEHFTGGYTLRSICQKLEFNGSGIREVPTYEAKNCQDRKK